VLASFLVIPLSMMLGSHAVAFRGVLVMLGGFVVGVLGHNSSPLFDDASNTRVRQGACRRI
jgi:hypothetical protein